MSALLTRSRLEDFHNRMRILTNIDLAELREAGVTMGANTWAEFAINPWKWFVRASDDDAAKIWTIIERRAGKAPAVEDRGD